MLRVNLSQKQKKQVMLRIKTLHHRKVKRKHQKLKVNQRVIWVRINIYLFLFHSFVFIDVELDKTGVIEGDNDPAQPMGDPNLEVYVIL